MEERRERDSAALRLRYLDALPGGSLQRLQLTASGRTGYFHMPPYESKLSTAPYENSPAQKR